MEEVNMTTKTHSISFSTNKRLPNNCQTTNSLSQKLSAAILKSNWEIERH